MPKTRRSNTIGNTALETTEQSARQRRATDEMVRRVNERLNQSREIDVPVYSSRSRSEEPVHVTFYNTPGRAMARSVSGRSYQVNYEDGTCNCIGYRTRGRCRHIQAVQGAIGLMNENRETQENSQNGIDATLQRMDAQEEAQRRALTHSIENEDDGFFYTDEENEGQFQEVMRTYKGRKLPYAHENVLNGSQNTFGIELEFVEGDADAIARELHALGICAYNRRVGYHAASVPGKWKLERDGTVSSGSKGGELVSPILKDTPETWRTLETICKVAKRHGAKINSKCGGHIHMGIEPLDTARQRWRRFFRSIGGFEDVIYRLAGGSEGSIRSGYRSYATPFADNARHTAVHPFRLDDRNDIDALAQRASQRNRYHGINLTNIYQYGRPNTVEFRYFNGSLDPSVIQANIKIANGILSASEKARTQDTEDMRVPDTMKRRGRMLKEHPLERNTHTDHSAIRKFVDIMFTRKQDKDAIIGLYAKNKWA